jgi:hypothetical protein
MRGKHKMIECGVCKKEKDVRVFEKDGSVCKVCSKGKAKTVVNVAVSDHLDANALA